MSKPECIVAKILDPATLPSTREYPYLPEGINPGLDIPAGPVEPNTSSITRNICEKCGNCVLQIVDSTDDGSSVTSREAIIRGRDLSGCADGRPSYDRILAMKKISF